MILPAQTIRALKIISPFQERYTSHGLTGGLTCAGYDVRIAESFILWPKQFRLGSTIERFKVPSDLTFKVEDKSTWARRGLSLFNTTAEPAWEGWLTLELVNHSWRPLRIKRGMPIAQVVFHRLEDPTELPYSGRYQSQPAGAQPAKEAA